MTSPLPTVVSPIRPNEDYKRKRNDDEYLIPQDIEELLYAMIESIDNNVTVLSNKTIKRQKT